MLNRVYNTAKPEHPLAAFDRLDCFKLFVFDTGLLKHMAGIDNSAILLKTDYQFKGALTENYVLQQVKGREDKSAPSFKHYVSEHTPEHALLFSRRGYVTNSRITNLPLYLARKTRALL